jgi:hypothetical protein
MLRRFTIAGLCALGLAGLAAGSASAQLYVFTPSQIQVWNASGLASTIVCTTTTTAPGCDYRGLDGRPDDQIPLLTAYRHDNVDDGYRILDKFGRWYQEGGSKAVLDAMDHADATGGPGASVGGELSYDFLYGPGALARYTAAHPENVAGVRGAQAAKKKGHGHVHAAKKKGHGKKLHAAKKGHLSKK